MSFWKASSGRARRRDMVLLTDARSALLAGRSRGRQRRKKVGGSACMHEDERA